MTFAVEVRAPDGEDFSAFRGEHLSGSVMGHEVELRFDGGPLSWCAGKPLRGTVVAAGVSQRDRTITLTVRVQD